MNKYSHREVFNRYFHAKFELTTVELFKFFYDPLLKCKIKYYNYNKIRYNYYNVGLKIRSRKLFER